MFNPYLFYFYIHYVMYIQPLSILFIQDIFAGTVLGIVAKGVKISRDQFYDLRHFQIRDKTA